MGNFSHFLEHLNPGPNYNIHHNIRIKRMGLII